VDRSRAAGAGLCDPVPGPNTWERPLMDDALEYTALYDLHVDLGAKMVPFAGYHMPVQYPLGVMAEHLHTRAACGLFDVSHMGQVMLTGPSWDAVAFGADGRAGAGRRATALRVLHERKRRH